MNAIATDLQGFFAGFGLDAFGANRVPDFARLPYLTYETVDPGPGGRAALRAWVWFREGDGPAAMAVCDAIRQAVDEGGAPLGCGAVIVAESPFGRMVADPVRRARGVEMRFGVVG